MLIVSFTQTEVNVQIRFRQIELLYIFLIPLLPCLTTNIIILKISPKFFKLLETIGWIQWTFVSYCCDTMNFLWGTILTALLWPKGSIFCALRRSRMDTYGSRPPRAATRSQPFFESQMKRFLIFATRIYKWMMDGSCDDAYTAYSATTPCKFHMFLSFLALHIFFFFLLFTFFRFLTLDLIRAVLIMSQNRWLCITESSIIS